MLLVLTCLHQAAGAANISKGADPFDALATSAATVPVASQIPEALQTLIDAKKQQFDGLFDALVPIDLTQPETVLPTRTLAVRV